MPAQVFVPSDGNVPENLIPILRAHSDYSRATARVMLSNLLKNTRVLDSANGI